MSLSVGSRGAFRAIALKSSTESVTLPSQDGTFVDESLRSHDFERLHADGQLLHDMLLRRRS